MKFIFFLSLIFYFSLKTQIVGKKLSKQILEKLDSFLGHLNPTPIDENKKNSNFSNEIIEHLDFQIRNFSTRLYIPPKINEEIEFFAKYCNYNISILEIEYYENFNGLKARRLDLNLYLGFFMEKFKELEKRIFIPPGSPNEFIKQIYPRIYFVYAIFFEFCNKSINHGLFSRHFTFKKVLTFFLYFYLSFLIKVLEISKEVAQKFEYFDCSIVFEIYSTLNLIQDARMNDKNFFTHLETKFIEETINKLHNRMKEFRFFLNNVEDLCNLNIIVDI